MLSEEICHARFGRIGHGNFRSCVFAFALFLAACGRGGVETGPVPSLALFAGDMKSNGDADGVGAAARFDGLQSVASDSAGNV